MEDTGTNSGCKRLLPVLRVRCGHGSGYVTHLEWYAPPVTLWREEGLSRGARGVRDGGGGDGRSAETRGLGRQSFPANLRHRGAPFDVWGGLTHVLYWNNKKKEFNEFLVEVYFHCHFIQP